GEAAPEVERGTRAPEVDRHVVDGQRRVGIVVEADGPGVDRRRCADVDDVRRACPWHGKVRAGAEIVGVTDEDTQRDGRELDVARIVRGTWRECEEGGGGVGEAGRGDVEAVRPGRLHDGE